ncbi:MAG: FAD-binding domain-containing protein [Alphaproteobacteria bacterium]
MENFIDKGGLKYYSKKRNFDLGIGKKSNVSMLSPFIRKRILNEQEVIFKCLQKFKYLEIEKFIQEIFWRTYWKGWLEGRKEVWIEYRKNLSLLKCNYKTGIKKKLYNKAIEANTPIDCFNYWAKEIVEFGYLHNHARMWFASIWIHTLKLPWELGADFFLKNLLDGDPASNTLSWRWVAGLHTYGKMYIAKEDNINKFTLNRFSQKNYLNKTSEIPDFKNYEHNPTNFIEAKVKNNSCFLININNLNYYENYINFLSNLNVFCVLDMKYLNLNKLPMEFNKIALEEYILFLKKKNINVEVFENFNDFFKFLKKNNYNNFFSPYPSIGYELDLINLETKQNHLNVNYNYNSYDLKCWPHASSGFFKFKKKIPELINDID